MTANVSKIKLELISDSDIHLFVEKAKRGSSSMITHHFDEATETSNIIYLDANNYYGWAMCQNLPTGNFNGLTVSMNLNKF